MSKDKKGKLLYIDNVTILVLKEIAKRYNCSESAIIRKALHNYIGLYQDIVKHGKEEKKKDLMVGG